MLSHLNRRVRNNLAVKLPFLDLLQYLDLPSQHRTSIANVMV